MNLIKLLIYSLIFISMFTISLIVSIDLNSVNLVFSVILSTCLTLYLFAIMNFLSVRKISGFYMKENSNDIKMKLISYLMIFNTAFQSMLITIVFCNQSSENLLSLFIKTLIIYLFTILFLFSMSIKTKGKKDEI